MAGYNGYSMSNNAVAAYEDGEMPASKIGHGIPVELIQAWVKPSSWHHTSKHYNKTDFYCLDEVLAVFGKQISEIYDPNPLAIEALANFKKVKKQTEIYENSTVNWLEWSGSRNYPKCTKKQETNCTVAITGKTAKVYKDGKLLVTKRLDTNGFSFTK